MRKNLFLTLALALFTVVGAMAQDWSFTLGKVEGLPGTEGTNSQFTYESKLFTLPAPTEGFRYTVIETTTNRTYFALAELEVLDKDGNKIAYEATTNADQNATGSPDGAGLPGLNDGKTATFFHSTWSADALALIEGPHYLELTFAEPVQEFSLRWVTRASNGSDKPTLVGLTPLNVEFVPYKEFEFSLGSPITTMEELEAAKFIAIKGNAPATFKNMAEDYEYVGPRFVVGAYKHAIEEEVNVNAIAQLIPNGDGTYKLYWNLLNAYLHDSGHADYFNGANGWQHHTTAATGAAAVQLRAVDGKFEMWYSTTRNADKPELELHVAQDVRHDASTQLKTFTAGGKAEIEAGELNGEGKYGTESNYGLPANFKFTIYSVNVNEDAIAPYSGFAVKSAQTALLTKVEEATGILEEYAEVEGVDVATYEAAIATATAVAEKEDATLTEVLDANAALELAGIVYLQGVGEYYADLIDGYLSDDNADLFTESREPGKYPVSAKADYLAPASDDAYAVMEASITGEYTLAQVLQMIANIESKLAQFEASIVKISEFPAMYKDIASEIIENNRTWTSNEVMLAEPVNGIRLTFLKNNSPHIAGTILNGYPVIALAEFELFDEEGEKVVLTVDQFASNSVHPGEGCLANLCNGIYQAEDGVTQEGYEYWHSKWSGTYEPAGYVYLDVTFPEPMSIFKFKLVGRSTNGQRDQNYPVEFVITPQGEAYDPLLFTENPYNVTIGEQVTAVDQITDGYYVIRGLLNTHPTYGADEEGNIKGAGYYYKGNAWFHSNKAAIRENNVFKISTNEDGTRSILSLGTGKYWPAFDDEGNDGYIGEATYKKDAAKLHFAAAEGELKGSILIYEQNNAWERDIQVIEGADTSYKAVSTPYALFMDWNKGLAARPVVGLQPGTEHPEYAMLEYEDNAGDSLHFAKKNGESQWELYRVTLEHPDFVYLNNLVAAVEGLGVEHGTDPGQYADLGNLPAALEAASACIADSAYANATAQAAALEAAMAVLESAVQNPVVAGTEYMLVSGLEAYYTQQGVSKAMYVNADDMTLGWTDLPAERDNAFVFVFEKATQDEDGVELSEENRAKAFSIKNVASGQYIGVVEGGSTEVPLSEIPWTYVTKNVQGAKFNIWEAQQGEWYGLHTNQHGGGSGAGSNIVYWNGNEAEASWWRIMSVESALSVEDLVVEGAEVATVSYFTPAGAQVPAPVKGINIVVVVYTNGVVETKKVLVK